MQPNAFVSSLGRVASSPPGFLILTFPCCSSRPNVDLAVVAALLGWLVGCSLARRTDRQAARARPSFCPSARLASWFASIPGDRKTDGEEQTQGLRGVNTLPSRCRATDQRAEEKQTHAESERKSAHATASFLLHPRHDCCCCGSLVGSRDGLSSNKSF